MKNNINSKVISIFFLNQKISFVLFAMYFFVFFSKTFFVFGEPASILSHSSLSTPFATKMLNIAQKRMYQLGLATHVMQESDLVAPDRDFIFSERRFQSRSSGFFFDATLVNTEKYKGMFVEYRNDTVNTAIVREFISETGEVTEIDFLETSNFLNAGQEKMFFSDLKSPFFVIPANYLKNFEEQFKYVNENKIYDVVPLVNYQRSILIYGKDYINGQLIMGIFSKEKDNTEFIKPFFSSVPKTNEDIKKDYTLVRDINITWNSRIVEVMRRETKKKMAFKITGDEFSEKKLKVMERLSELAYETPYLTKIFGYFPTKSSVSRIWSWFNWRRSDRPLEGDFLLNFKPNETPVMGSMQLLEVLSAGNEFLSQDFIDDYPTFKLQKGILDVFLAKKGISVADPHPSNVCLKRVPLTGMEYLGVKLDENYKYWATKIGNIYLYWTKPTLIPKRCDYDNWSFTEPTTDQETSQDKVLNFLASKLEIKVTDLLRLYSKPRDATYDNTLFIHPE